MFKHLQKVLTLNPIGAFIWGIIAKWYIMLLIACMVVAYWFIQGLLSAGVIQRAEKTFVKALNDVKSIAKYCTPLITNFNQYVKCVQTDFTYVETNSDVKALETFGKKVEEQINQNFQNQIKENPYE